MFKSKIMQNAMKSKPLRTGTDRRDPAKYLAMGKGWGVLLPRDGKYVLEYLSGEHAGGERTIVIDADQALGLRDGTVTLNEVLIAHHAS